MLSVGTRRGSASVLKNMMKMAPCWLLVFLSHLLLVTASAEVLVVDSSGKIGPAANYSAPCGRHLKLYEDSLSTQLWAMQMFDATGKIPTGVLYGSPVDMGNFDECVQISVKTPDGDEFGGKHCLAAVSQGGGQGGIRQPSMEMLALGIKEKNNVDIQTIVGSAIPDLGGFGVTIGACLPSSCTAEDFNVYLKSKSGLLLPGLTFSADEGHCSDGKKDPFRPIDWFAIGLFIVFGLLALGSTTYDLMTAKSDSRKELLLAFSWYTNGQKIFSTRRSAMDLSCLHGVRFLSMFWVVLGHRYGNNTFLPNSNQSELIKQYVSNWGYLFLQSSTLSVDSFFLLSGILVSYVFLNGVHKGAKFNIFLYYLHRYIRLTPSLMVLILLYVSLVKYMGSGPYYAASLPPTCNELWWQNLLYVNNYLHYNEGCVNQAWYLACDMQLYWLSPLVLIPLWKKPRIGQVLVGVLTLTSLAITFGICYHYKVATYIKAIMLGGEYQLNYGLYYYGYTHARFTPWLVGIALGYIMYKIKIKPAGSFKMTPVQCLCLWTLAAFFMLVSLCGTFGANQADHEYNVLEATFFNTFSRPVWALGLALVIFACSTGYGGPVDTFLSWSFFMPMSKLTYGIYLYHEAVQIIISYTLRTKIYINDMGSISDAFGDIVFSTLVAIVMCLLFESPFLVLEKLLLGGKSKKKVVPAPEKDPASVWAEKTKPETDPEAPSTAEDLPPLSNGNYATDKSDRKDS